MNWSDSFASYGAGKLTPPAGLKDEKLGARLAQYKRSVAKRYRVLEPDGLERQLPKGSLWISTKLDGELWFLVKREGEVALCAYNGRVLQGVPVTAEAEARLKGVDSVIVAGELLAPLPGTEGRPRCYHVSRTLSDAALAEHLTFHAFDLVEDGGKDTIDRPYGERLARLKSLFPDGGKTSVVTTVEGDAAAAAGYYREWVATQKFEGLVVRSEQGITFKIKPTFTLDALVVAFGERVINGVTQVRELEVALLRDDGTLHILGSVGGGFSEDDRVRWREKLDPLVVASSFRLANREGTLCRFVAPKTVVEVRCNDLVDADGNDSSILRMTLKYEDGKGYAPIGPMPIVSMVSPVFLRERTDKLPDAGSVGLDQVFSRLPFDSRFSSATVSARAEPSIVERKVFVKETKGQTAVRKYVAIATNRGHDRNWPPYVVHFTDFSAGRAEPLKVSLRVASTTDSLRKHIQAWVEDNVKRGWVEHGAAAAAPAPSPAAPAAATSAAPDAAADAAPAADGAAPKKPRKPRAKKTDTAT